MRYSNSIAALAVSALLWTGAGESSDPALKTAELPADVLNDCTTVTISAARPPCSSVNYRSRWIGRAARSELFLVEREACAPEGCRSWLVARERNGATRTLLAVTGQLRLDLDGDKFPTVYSRLELADSYTSYNRFEWSGEQYERTETRLMHRIDGFECGDEAECRAAAQEALRQNRADRAVRIWQQVHGVDWI